MSAKENPQMTDASQQARQCGQGKRLKIVHADNRDGAGQGAPH